MPPISRTSRRKNPPKKRTKKKEKARQKSSFLIIFRFINLKEILRESKNANPLIEYLRAKQLLFYFESEKKFYGLKEKEREVFLAKNLQRLREQFKEIEALIVKIKRIEAIRRKDEARGTPKHATWNKMAKILSFFDRASLIHEAIDNRAEVLRKAKHLFHQSNLWERQ